MFCRKCGKKIDEDSKFCTDCGEKMHHSDDQTTVESEALIADPQKIEAAKKNVKNAIIAALISAGVTAIASIFNLLGYDYYNFFDVALIWGLAYGIYKYNRTCGVIMVVYFIFSKIISIGDLISNPFSIFVAILFFYYYWLGMMATFEYHKYKNIN